MCEHCENRVRAALSEIDGLEVQNVSYEKGTAEVRLSAPVDKTQVIKAVSDAGYKVRKFRSEI